MGGRGAGSSGKAGKEKKEAVATGGGGGATATVLDYQDLGYKSLNAKLRAGEKLNKKEGATLKGVENSMKKTTKDMELYLGLDNGVGKQLNKLNAGQIMKDKALLSTSKSKEVFKHEFGKGWKATITVPAGTKVLDLNKTLGKKSRYADEKEVILPRSTKLGIVGIDHRAKTVQYRVLK